MYMLKVDMTTIGRFWEGVEEQFSLKYTGLETKVS